MMRAIKGRSEMSFYYQDFIKIKPLGDNNGPAMVIVVHPQPIHNISHTVSDLVNALAQINPCDSDKHLGLRGVQ